MAALSQSCPFDTFRLKLTDQIRLLAAYFRFRPDGFYVDVGANDPFDNSNTWALERLGWKGIVIEPLPDLAARLRQQRNATVFECVCTEPSRAGQPLEFWVNGPLSTLSPHRTPSTTLFHDHIAVNSRTLDDILFEADAPQGFQLLTVDTQGNEILVLRGFDFDHWRPELIFLRDLVLDRHLHTYVRRRNYTIIHRSEINSWYARRDLCPSLSIGKKLEFIRKFYLGTPFRQFSFWRRRKRRDTQWHMAQS
ncbi:MAG: FkbM family methyltransferase [Rhodospirillaceae bacterium]|nr:FkbM family methyltransferase [Rhodospirillaceae bacterium]